ncbi:hypothetical protein [Pantoea stewartii]|uniref:hypothetical protein n=1 Tax=Pantoea stewartii TaxID=66269 RepID=UPI0025A1D80B|nr:hypothetical protein [Pantoea stewartii]
MDYLLRKRPPARDGATVLQGKPEGGLIERLACASLSVSFPADILPGQREKLMASFERVHDAGLPMLNKSAYCGCYR